VDYLNISVNEVRTTVTSKSNFGYNSNSQNQGLGFQFGEEGLLYEGGFMCGKDTLSVSDNLRSVSGNQSADFVGLERVIKIPQTQAEFESISHYADNANPLPMPVSVRQHTLAYNSPGHKRYVIFDYWVKNEGINPLPNFYAGIFTDWDIMDYNKNRVGEVSSQKLGYAFSTENQGLYAGVKFLSGGNFVHYAIDNIVGGGGGLDIFAGFPEAKKYFSLSNNRPQAGQNGTGNDIAQGVSSGPYFIPGGDSVRLSFAILAAESLEELLHSADSAQAKYDGANLSSGFSKNEINCLKSCNFFPNPVADELNFNACLGLGLRYYVGITSIDGRQWVRNYFDASKNQQLKLDTRLLPKGMYILSVENPTGGCKIKLVKD
jgi:hypothetical protein